MIIILKDEKCIDKDAEIPEGCHPIRLKDSSRAFRCIITNCTQSILTSLINFDTATAAWDFLYKTYSGVNFARKFQGIKCIATLQYNQGSIESNLESLSLLIADTTTAAGLETISITELAINTFLNCLPARFGNVRSFLELQPTPYRSTLFDLIYSTRKSGIKPET